jgi:hypothetical protein
MKVVLLCGVGGRPPMVASAAWLPRSGNGPPGRHHDHACAGHGHRDRDGDDRAGPAAGVGQGLVLFASWILPASPMTCSARPCSATSEARMAPTTRSPAGHHGNYARPLRGISGRAGRCGVMGARHGHRRRPGACHHASLAEWPAVVRCWWHERVWPLGRLDDVPQACLEGLAQFRMSTLTLPARWHSLSAWPVRGAQGAAWGSRWPRRWASASPTSPVSSGHHACSPDPDSETPVVKPR